MPPINFQSSGVGIYASGVTVAEWQHVIGPSATALIVAANIGWPATTPVVKVGTKTMTFLGSTVFNSRWTQIYGILSPPTGAQTIRMTSDNPIAVTANSVAYTNVASFGTVSFDTFPQIPYSVTKTVPIGSWLVSAIGVAGNGGVVSPATSGTDRFIKKSQLTLAILDGVSTTGSVTLTLSSVANANGDAASVVLVPVAGDAIAHTVNSSLAVTATLSSTADATSVRMCVANMPVTAQLSATATAVGQKQSASSLPVTATLSANVTASRRVSASLAVTVTRQARPQSTTWVFHSQLSATATTSSTATVTLAPMPPSPEHSPLRYVGRYPDIQAGIAPKSYSVAANDRTKVTTDWIEKAVDNVVHSLATVQYVDQQDNARALKSAVTQADQNYVPATGHNLATLNNEGRISPEQIPSGNIIISNRQAKCFTGSVGSGSVVSASYTALLLGTVTINDPKLVYPYVVLPFAWVNGNDPNGTAASRWSGTGNVARLLVMPVGGGPVCGSGICAASPRASAYPVTPSSPIGSRAQKFTGSLTLGLYGSVFSEATGQSYTFSGGSFFVLVIPAV